MRRAAILLAALLTATAGAQAAPYVIDKAHTQVTFSVNHLGFSAVSGLFRAFDAEIDFDPGNVEATRVIFVIDAASVDTFWEARDKHVRSRDFLDVATYPTIRFVSTAVVPTGTNEADISGNLTIRGVTLPVTLKARLNKLGPSPFNPSQTIAGFTVTGEIDRRDFGVSFAAPAVGALVPLRIELEMSPAR